MRLSVFVSGSGSLLGAMIEAGIPISLVVADRPCTGVEIATSAGIDVAVVERTQWRDDFDRDQFTERVIEVLEEHRIDLVAMAGFGTILGAPLFEKFENRIINTHPALLPSFPGWHAVRDALNYGVKVTGCTIHVATPVVDDGPIIAQQAIAVEPDDDELTLHERIKAVERQLYVETLRIILERGSVLASPSPSSPTGAPS